MLLTNTSVWVDYKLKLLLKEFTWILCDSKSLCHDLLELKLPPGENIWLVTGDIVAIYPNILTDEGIKHIAGILKTSLKEFSTPKEAAPWLTMDVKIQS
jgi:hypothetical protein